MQSIGDRIKEIRESNDRMSQSAFASKIGTTAAAVSRYEGGQRSVPTTVILSICREFGVRREWLETGEGAMEIETESQMFDRIARRYSSTRTFRLMMDVYAKLGEEEQKAIERYIEQLAVAFAHGENPASVYPQQEEPLYKTDSTWAQSKTLSETGKTAENSDTQKPQL